MSDSDVLIVDDPAAHIRRLTLNRPEKRNALSSELRGKIYQALDAADDDRDVRVIIIRGNGECFSAGYDLAGWRDELPWHTAGGDGQWPRHLNDGHFRVWDMRKPVIAQVHGYCLAGGTELMSSCDLVYVSEDAQIGYPPVRAISPPDMQVFPWLCGMRQAMELMLTGDSISGAEAVEYGIANRVFPKDSLDDAVLEIAARVAKAPTDIQQLNKRSVHKAMEIQGIRTALRNGSDLVALAAHQRSSKEYMEKVRTNLNEALNERDRPYGDYRTKDKDT